MLLRPESHARLLDGSAGLLAVRDAVAEAYAKVRAIDSELERLRADEQQREQRRDFLAFQVKEIDSAGLDAGSVETLRADRARLAHANRLQSDGAEALAALTGESDSDGAESVTDRLAGVARRVTGMAELDPSLAGLAERLAASQDELRDASLDLERYVAAVEADPARLADADERLHRIEGLQRKYGATVAEVLAFRDRAAAELAAVEGADERANQLLAERAQTCRTLAAEAKRLTKGRVRAARRLADEVLSSLRQLAMPEAQFEVSLEPASAPADLPCGPAGAESPVFVFSANPGEALRPLRAVASGGELSRVFLALKQALRESAAGMVLVFDEVDSGVGGRVADRVGSMLAELAVHHQVLCITHLPQIAAFAQTHFRVAKDVSDGRTRTGIARIEGAERVAEIARMAGGESVGAATLAHARELLASRSAPRS
jgi:DNA repair protein RecN (Recombination protein N)